MHSSASPCIAQQNLHECSSPQSKLAESFLFHPFPVSEPRCPGVGAECQCPVVEGTQEFRGDALQGAGAGLVGGGAAGANTGYGTPGSFLSHWGGLRFN